MDGYTPHWPDGHDHRAPAAAQSTIGGLDLPEAAVDGQDGSYQGGQPMMYPHHGHTQPLPHHVAYPGYGQQHHPFGNAAMPYGVHAMPYPMQGSPAMMPPDIASQHYHGGPPTFYPGAAMGGHQYAYNQSPSPAPHGHATPPSGVTLEDRMGSMGVEEATHSTLAGPSQMSSSRRTILNRSGGAPSSLPAKPVFVAAVPDGDMIHAAGSSHGSSPMAMQHGLPIIVSSSRLDSTASTKTFQRRPPQPAATTTQNVNLVPAAAPTVPLLARLPPMPSPPNNDGTLTTEELVEAFRKREEALLLRIEAIGFQPDHAWRAMQQVKGRVDGEEHEKAQDMAAPVLGIRLLQKLDELQRENDELGQMLAQRIEPNRTAATTGTSTGQEGPTVSLTKEIQDAHTLIQQLDAALTKSEARAEAAEAKVKSQEQALAIACAKQSSAIDGERSGAPQGGYGAHDRRSSHSKGKDGHAVPPPSARRGQERNQTGAKAREGKGAPWNKT